MDEYEPRPCCAICSKIVEKEGVVLTSKGIEGINRASKEKEVIQLLSKRVTAYTKNADENTATRLIFKNVIGRRKK